MLGVATARHPVPTMQDLEVATVTAHHRGVEHDGPHEPHEPHEAARAEQGHDFLDDVQRRLGVGERQGRCTTLRAAARAAHRCAEASG